MLQEMYSIQQLEAENDRLVKQIEVIKNDPELKRLKSEFHKLKDSVEVLEQKLNENKSKQEECFTQKQKIEKEINDFNEKNSTEAKVVEDLERKKLHIQKQREQLPQLDDKKLAFERIWEKLSHEDIELKKKAKFIKDKFDKHKLELKTKITTIEQSLEGNKANLDAIMTIISPELLEQYESLRIRFVVPVVRVVGGKCSSCGNTLSDELSAKIGVDEEGSVCEGCGRMLMK